MPFSQELQEEIDAKIQAREETISQETDDYGPAELDPNKEDRSEPWDITTDAGIELMLNEILDGCEYYIYASKKGDEDGSGLPHAKRLQKEIRLWLIEKGCYKHYTEKELENVCVSHGKKWDFVIDGKKYRWERHL